MDGAIPSASNCEFSFEFVPGFRHNSKLLYVKEEQQFYRVNTASLVSVHYLCNVKTCRRRAYIRNGKCFAAPGSHNHPNQADLYIDLIALNEMKRIARNVDNHLKAKEIFDLVKKKYPNCKFAFKKYERILQMTCKEALQKVRKNVPKETAPKKAEDILVNDTVNIHIDNNEFQQVEVDVTNVSLAIEPIEITTNDLDNTIEPIAESTGVVHSSPKASTTCVRIEKAANDLRNNRFLKELEIPTIYEIDSVSTLSSTDLEVSTEIDSENSNSSSLKSNGESALIILSDIFDNTIEPIDQSIATGDSSTQAFTTCARIDKAANQLRSNQFSKEADFTLLSTYLEDSTENGSENGNSSLPKSHNGPDLLTKSDIFDKPNNPVAQSTAVGYNLSQASTTSAHIEKAANVRVDMELNNEIPTTSKDEFHVVYMREADINRLFKRGYLSFVQGKLQYDEPKQDSENITRRDVVVDVQLNQLEVDTGNATQNFGGNATQHYEPQLISMERESERSVNQNTKETENQNNMPVDVMPKQLTVEKMPGKRSGSEIIYSVEEEQFYIKKRKLSNGKVLAVCRHSDCNKRIYIDESACTATYDGLHSKHEHSPQKLKYDRLKSLNRIKQVCANPNIAASNVRKTSVLKTIFNAAQQPQFIDK